MGTQKRIIEKRGRKLSQKPFGMVEHATITSKAWEMLKSTEAHVYNILKTFYRGEKKPFKAPFNALMYRTRIQHPGTIQKAITGLEAKKWINVKRYAKHGKKRGLRVRPNEYELTFKYDTTRW